MKGWRTWIALALSCLFWSATAGDDGIAQAARRIEADAGAHRLIVLGEVHGTRETPRLAATLAQHYARQGPLLLAIEISRVEHVALARYLRAPGGHMRAPLRRGAGWRVPAERNDGRRSEQMLDLVDAMRQLRAHGRDVAILPFDPDAGDARQRDRSMALILRKACLALQRGRVLVLTGNVHAMRTTPGYCPQCQQPMTSLLRDLDPYAVAIGASTGQAWICVADGCGPHAAGGVFLDPGPQGGDPARVYDDQIVLPRFTPATPIRAHGPPMTRR